LHNSLLNIFGPSAPAIAVAPSITTTIQNTFLVYCVSTIDTEGVFADLQTPPAGMILEQSGRSSVGFDSQVAIHDAPFGPIGATGTRSQTISSTDEPPADQVTAFNYLLALQPICLD